jgi:hypothetical protein
MTVTLHLRPEVEAGLLARAQANGKVLEDYVLSVVEEAAFSAAGSDEQSAEPIERAEAVRRMLAFGDRYRLSLGEPITRALLHEGHRF